MNLFKIESYKKGILISTIFNFLAKLIGFLNSIVVAYYFGTQGKTDVYFYSFATLSLIAAFIINLNGLVLIPESMRIRELEGLSKSISFLNFFIYLYLIISILFACILLYDPIQSFTFISKFNYTLLHDNLKILIFITPLFTFIVVSSLLTEILTSFKYFTIPMIAAVINSLLSLTFVIAFHKSLDVLSIVLALSLGYVINILLLVFLMKKQLNWNFKFKLIKIRKLVLKNLFFAEAGNIISVLGTYVPLYLISGFNQGVITALNYGRNLANIPDQFITAQVSSIAGIKMNEVFAKKNDHHINEVFTNSMNLLFFILIPISLIFYFFSTEIIVLVYKRGAFNHESVIQSAAFLKYFGLILPFIALNSISSRLFTAGQKIVVNFYAGLIVNCLFLLILFIFINRIGPIGYPIAMLTYLPISVFVVNYFLIKKYFTSLNFLNIIILYFKILILNITIGAPVFFLYTQILSTYNNLIILPLIFALYMAFLIVANNFIKINNDIILVQNKLLSLFKIYTHEENRKN